MWGLLAGNGHSPHKRLVAARFDEFGAELGEEGKGMVLEGNPREYGQSPSRTLRQVWRDRAQYCGQGWSTDVHGVLVLRRVSRHGGRRPNPPLSSAAEEEGEYPRSLDERRDEP